ncbi:VanZ family protein [Janibacter sp. GS2]|uniref:VanZ family protein n=1 Tax=Janibacter sp. GS2 TaxID=3442646 RepID=UPI003EBA5B42
MSTIAPRRPLVLAVVVVLMVVQSVVVYLPLGPGPPSSIPHSDKVIHAVVFGGPILVAGLAKGRSWLLVGLVSAVHAPVSEVIQHRFLIHRSGDPWDVGADFVGIGLALAGVSLVLRRPRRRRL